MFGDWYTQLSFIYLIYFQGSLLTYGNTGLKFNYYFEEIMSRKSR